MASKRARDIYVMFVVMGLLSSAEAAEFPSTQVIIQDTEKLETDWAREKKEYRAKFKEQMDQINRRLTALRNTLDNGDRDKRAQINEEIADLTRKSDDIRQIYHEITAAAGIKWGNVPGDVKDSIEDMQD